MRNRQHVVLSIALMVFVGCQGGCAQTRSNMPSSNVTNWFTREIPEYRMTFRYPPDGVLGDKGIWLPGLTTVDGRKKARSQVGMRPKYSRLLLDGVSYEFEVRFIMITEAAELNPMYAKRHGWTEKPTINLCPFDY